MILFYLIPIVSILIAGVCSYFISRRLYRQLVSARVKGAKVIAGCTFVACLLLMSYIIIYLIAVNINFTR
jgi:hypothetical protein